MIEICILEDSKIRDRFHTIPVITSHPPGLWRFPVFPVVQLGVDTFAFLILALPLNYLPIDYYYY